MTRLSLILIVILLGLLPCCDGLEILLIPHVKGLQQSHHINPHHILTIIQVVVAQAVHHLTIFDLRSNLWTNPSINSLCDLVHESNIPSFNEHTARSPGHDCSLLQMNGKLDLLHTNLSLPWYTYDLYGYCV
jgi:hypothetical protein